jgi:hypothetical protein
MEGESTAKTQREKKSTFYFYLRPLQHAPITFQFILTTILVTELSGYWESAEETTIFSWIIF